MKSVTLPQICCSSRHKATWQIFSPFFYISPPNVRVKELLTSVQFAKAVTKRLIQCFFRFEVTCV